MPVERHEPAEYIMWLLHFEAADGLTEQQKHFSTSQSSVGGRGSTLRQRIINSRFSIEPGVIVVSFTATT